MKKITFVTGGTGLLGSHLLYKLVSEGEHVIAAYRKNSNTTFTKKVFRFYSHNYEKLFDSIEWIECDMLDYESINKAIKNCSHVYHCAAIVSFTEGETAAIIKNNVAGTANVVKAAIVNGIEKFCHVSSTAAIGASDNEILADEKHEWNESQLHSGYAVSKYLSEAEAWKGYRNGLCTVIVNPSVIIGPGDWSRGSSQYFPVISRGLPFYTNGITGYVDVNDVTGSMIMLMNSAISGERFIISSENLSYGEVFKMIAKSLHVRKPFIFIPKTLSLPALSVIQFFAKITGKRLPVSGQLLRTAYSKVTFNNSKIIKATGIKFKSIEESVAATASFFKAENQ